MMGPRRGDTICGNVAIEALGPMHFGALALGPVHLARSPTEPSMWLATVERTLLPRSVDVSRFMAGVGELAARTIAGAVPVVLVDREADFCVVGYRAIEGARTVATIAESGADTCAAATLARQLAQTLAELHRGGAVHGLLTPTTVIHDGARWWTWEYGIAGLCAPDRLAPRLRPLGGDAAAPELRAGGEVSATSDVYGWGTAVACLLTGGTGSDAVAMLQDSDATDPLTELCRAALESIPELRPRNGDVLLSRLTEALGPDDVAHAAPRRDATEHARFALPEDPPSSRGGSDAKAADAQAADDSGEFSFAELNEGHASAPPMPVGTRDSTEIVELLVLGPDESVDDDDDEPAPPTFAHPSTGPDTSERWRELAEEYLSEAEREADGHKAVSEHLAAPPFEVVSPTDRRSLEALGRVALVRTRARTGPHTPTTSEHVAVSGSFEMSSDPVVEPETPPRAADGARELPLGTPEDEAEWDDPDAAVFDLDAPGAPRVGGGRAPDDDPEREDGPPPRGFVPGEPHSLWSKPSAVDGLGSRRALADRANDDTPALSPLIARRPPAPSMAAPTPASVPTIVVAQRAAPKESAPSMLASVTGVAETAVHEVGGPERPTPDSARLQLDRPGPTGPRRATPGDSGPRLRVGGPAESSDAAALPRIPLGEAPLVSPARARPSVESGARDPSRPTPIIGRPRAALIRAELAPPFALRERSGLWVGGTVAVIAGALAIGATLAAARQRGGLSRLLEDRPAPEIVDTLTADATIAAPSPVPNILPPSCPETMRAIGDTRVCIDEAEAPGLGKIPRTRVSLDEARAECAQRGARLCTAAQWRSACRGPRKWRYPYGSRPEVDRCNGASASGQPQNLSRTGARDNCVTPAGVFDLVGNVGEWVDEGSVLGGDSATRAPSCDTRSRAAAGTTSASTGYRCCVDLKDGG